MFVTYCLQLLLVLVVYPVPEGPNGIPPKNNFRHFLGRLHRPQDFQFLVNGMTRILNQPVWFSYHILELAQLLMIASFKPQALYFQEAKRH